MILEKRRLEYNQEVENAENEQNEIQSKINDMLYNKQRLTDSNSMLQRLVRNYQSLESKSPPLPATPRSTIREIDDAEDERSAILRSRVFKGRISRTFRCAHTRWGPHQHR